MAAHEPTPPPDPEEVEAVAPGPVPEIAPGARMGAVELAVADLDRSIAYYERSIGLSLVERADGRARLGAGGEPLLDLLEEPGARPADGYPGLYHFALLVPARTDLARYLVHAAREQVPLVGMADHFVSEAIYLSDPDHHGIEIYWDRPRETWEGQVGARMGTWPLDVDALVGELPDPAHVEFDGLAPGTTMGHVHLRVTDVDATIAFYRDVLGFGLMAQLGAQAAFLSAGGYHHHLGANTWETVRRSAPPSGTAALRHATIVLPEATERDRLIARIADAGRELEPAPRAGDAIVRDPSGNALLLSAG